MKTTTLNALLDFIVLAEKEMTKINHSLVALEPLFKVRAIVTVILQVQVLLEQRSLAHNKKFMLLLSVVVESQEYKRK